MKKNKKKNTITNKEDVVDNKKYRSKVPISNVLSVVAVVISITIGILEMNEYMIKESKITARFGEKISFSTLNEEFQIVIPVVFDNSGNADGVVDSLVLDLINTNNSNESYRLMYNVEMDIADAGEKILAPKNSDFPIEVDKKNNTYKLMNFSVGKRNANNESNLGIYPESGSYSLVLSGRTNFDSNDREELYRLDIVFSDENYNFMLNNTFCTMYAYGLEGGKISIDNN